MSTIGSWFIASADFSTITSTAADTAFAFRLSVATAENV